MRLTVLGGCGACAPGGSAPADALAFWPGTDRARSAAAAAERYAGEVLIADEG
jgi:hypothetical protein